MIIYKITNRLNGKPYIGQTSQPLEKRFLQHSKADSPLGDAMRKCGLENFTIEVVEECKTQKQASARERFWIKVLKCKVPNGYNRSDGGESPHPRNLKPQSMTPVKSTVDRKQQEKKQVGLGLRRFRDTFKLKQREVAEAIGVHPQLYLKYEQGETVPSAAIIMRVAVAFNVSADYLLGLSDTPRPATIDKDWISRLMASRDLIQSVLRDTGQVPAQ